MLILHLSDLHLNKENSNQIESIIDKLILDIKMNLKIDKIDFICFTGDFLQSGSKENFEDDVKLIDDFITNKLLEAFNVPRKNFIYSVGNHEVDKAIIDEIYEEGIEKVKNENIYNLEKFFNRVQSNTPYIDKISYFLEYNKSAYSMIFEDAFTRVIEDKANKIYFVCANSAFSSKGLGGNERGHMLINTNSLQEAILAIEATDYTKVLLMHHPLDWYEGPNKVSLEHCLLQFDLVLNGHTHEHNEAKVESYNKEYISCQAGMLYPIDRYYNGYKVIEYDNNSCTVYNRRFYKNRYEFDACNENASGGVSTYELGGSKEEQKRSRIYIDLKSNWVGEIKDKCINKNDLRDEIQSFQEWFVPPTFKCKHNFESPDNAVVTTNSLKREYKEVEFSNLLEDDCKNIITGKKESGKTTLLYGVMSELLNRTENILRIPVYIDLEKAKKSKRFIVNEILNFINMYVSDDFSVTREFVEQTLLQDGFVLFIDNVDRSNVKVRDIVISFLNEHPSIQYYMTLNEDPFAKAINVDIDLPGLNRDYRRLVLEPFSKKQIKKMLASYDFEQDKVSEISARLVNYFYETGMPRTPFLMSMIISIWTSQSELTPINEAAVISAYTEVVLEKTKLENSKLSNYSFKIKEDFLIKLAFHMYEKKSYAIAKLDFLNFLDRYHNRKGYDKNKSHFDKIFIERGILVEFDDNIAFKYNSLLEYYLALEAKTNKTFLNNILEKSNILKYQNVLFYLAGIESDGTCALESIEKVLIPFVEENKASIKVLDGFNLNTTFQIDVEKLDDKLDEMILSEDEVDKLTDKKNHDEYHPSTYGKEDITTVESGERITDLVFLYGRLIRISELLDKDIKKSKISRYIDFNLIVFGLLYDVIDDIIDDPEGTINLEMFYEAKNDIPKDELKNELKDIMRMALPLAIQQISLENIGNSKLEKVFNELRNEADGSFEEFMYTFLTFDIGDDKNLNIIEEYIGGLKNKELMKLSTMKLLQYLIFRSIVKKRDVDRVKKMIIDVQLSLDDSKHGNKINRRTELERNLQLRLDQVIPVFEN